MNIRDGQGQWRFVFLYQIEGILTLLFLESAEFSAILAQSDVGCNAR
jgi:hypothetical protein